ncbi:hypothetical protein WJX74_005304 [Apatococcus lobatus]|uniref:Uncharacterized protein n=1 Tax=Apatococcus lobatus TaxID=904363 RepID=A0AAW1S3K2_9CHLO
MQPSKARPGGKFCRLESSELVDLPCSRELTPQACGGGRKRGQPSNNPSGYTKAAHKNIRVPHKIKLPHRQGSPQSKA